MFNTKTIEKSEIVVNKKFDVYPSPWAECLQKLNGNINAVWLYNHFSWWWERAVKNGRDWVDLTRAQWIVNTGLSEYQYDTALRALKIAKLIEVKHDKAGRQKYLRTFIRLPTSADQGETMSAGPETVGTETIHGNQGKVDRTVPGKPGEVFETVPWKTGHNSGDANYQEIQNSGFFCADAENKNQDENLAEKNVETGWIDIPTPTKKKNASALAADPLAVWNKAMRQQHQSAPIPVRSWQAKRLMAVVSYVRENVPDLDPLAVLSAVIANWGDFCGHVKATSKIRIRHEQPDVGTVWNFIPDVVTFMRQDSASPQNLQLIAQGDDVDEYAGMTFMEKVKAKKAKFAEIEAKAAMSDQGEHKN